MEKNNIESLHVHPMKSEIVETENKPLFPMTVYYKKLLEYPQVKYKFIGLFEDGQGMTFEINSPNSFKDELTNFNDEILLPLDHPLYKIPWNMGISFEKLLIQTHDKGNLHSGKVWTDKA